MSRDDNVNGGTISPTPTVRVDPPDTSRRTFLRLLGAAGGLAALPASLLHACADRGTTQSPAAETGRPSSSTKGKRHPIKIGIIPLTDCASVVMAHELGLFAKHGVDVQVSREASWANVRDKLLTGELQAAHCLSSMPFSVYTGIGGNVGQELFLAMILNCNGQAITLSKELAEIGFGQLDKVSASIEALRAKRTVTFAMTFPGGTHDLWLRYWLAAAGVDQRIVRIITIPPPQMVANMKVGNMDGFCVGEPWNEMAARQGIGFTHLTTQDLWKQHPEKALVTNKTFSTERRDDLKAVMRAVLEASIWLDDLENRKRAASIIGQQSYVNAPPEVIEARLLGTYQLGCNLGERIYTDSAMQFHSGGRVNYPRKSHGIWFLCQYVRLGYLEKSPDFAAIADRLVLQDLYREVASDMAIAIPSDDMQPFALDLDRREFDPNNPLTYLKHHQG